MSYSDYKNNVAAYKQAQTEFDEVTEAMQAAGIDYETDEFLAANSKLTDAVNKLPRWRQFHT